LLNMLKLFSYKFKVNTVSVLLEQIKKNSALENCRTPVELK